VYETDLFQPVISLIESISGFGPDRDDTKTGMGGEKNESGVEVRRSKRIIAEHARATTFLIADGVMPGNDGRGYVLRRTLRRAVAYGRRLGLTRPFLTEIVRAVVGQYGAYYGELDDNKTFIENVVGAEEKRFIETLESGRVQLAEFLKDRVMDGKALAGVHAFLLYDTFGFPAELTAEIAAERGVSVDWNGFEKAMEEQRERARAAGRFRLSEAECAEAYAALSHLQPRFTGYDTFSQQTGVAGIIAGAAAVDSVEAGDEAEIVLFETPFYAEQGGQVGDKGEIKGPNGVFRVEDTQRTEGGLILHRGRVVEGRIAVNDDVLAQADASRCWDIRRNHTATHLLHAALRRVVGPHARQSGSLVAPDRLRFDFTHVEALKPDELAEVQRLVNEKIRENLPVRTERKSYEEATAGGATALFDEKYAAEVRVVEVAEESERYSAELCGGTHVHATGDIGQFIIVDEESIGAGLRRIEALTGRGADEYVQSRLGLLGRVRDKLAVTGGDAELEVRVNSLLEEMESLKRRVQTLERELGRNRAESLLAEAEHIDACALVAARVPASSPEALREIGDWLRERLGSGVVVLGTVVEGRPSLLAMVTPDLTARGLNAGELVKRAAQVTGGGGGGRPEMAQAGGRDASRLDEALRLAKEMAVEKIRGLKES
ncbi:MAG TPA: alanine--tRNA ligase, partial [Dehalococcoidia bacterium]|nr:alanine--tRNA ligase [Dehalococcoidia bacterium]